MSDESRDIKTLREELLGILISRRELRMICRDAGLDIARIDLDGGLELALDAALREAGRQGAEIIDRFAEALRRRRGLPRVRRHVDSWLADFGMGLGMGALLGLLVTLAVGTGIVTAFLSREAGDAARSSASPQEGLAATPEPNPCAPFLAPPGREESEQRPRPFPPLSAELAHTPTLVRVAGVPVEGLEPLELETFGDRREQWLACLLSAILDQHPKAVFLADAPPRADGVHPGEPTPGREALGHQLERAVRARVPVYFSQAQGYTPAFITCQLDRGELQENECILGYEQLWPVAVRRAISSQTGGGPAARLMGWPALLEDEDTFAVRILEELKRPPGEGAYAATTASLFARRTRKSILWLGWAAGSSDLAAPSLWAEELLTGRACAGCGAPYPGWKRPEPALHALEARVVVVSSLPIGTQQTLLIELDSEHAREVDGLETLALGVQSLREHRSLTIPGGE